jgi:Ca2+-binding RTX toxin-like protein
MKQARFVFVMAMVTVGVLVLAGSVALAAVTVKGTPEADHLVGTDKAENFIPYNGNDIVEAKGGNDTVHHSYGDDTIYGGSGNDTLRGGFGKDEIWGGPGNDLIDCAYVGDREANSDDDIAHIVEGEDTVVDCKTVIPDDTTT